MAPKIVPRHRNVVAEYKIIWDQVTAQCDEENNKPGDLITFTCSTTAPSEVSTTSTAPAAAAAAAPPPSTTSQPVGPSDAVNTSETRSYQAVFSWRDWRAMFSCAFSPSAGADKFEILHVNNSMALGVAGPGGDDDPKDLVSLKVCGKEDDDENSMLEFTADTGYSACIATGVTVWAKRVVDGKDEGLSKKEKELFRA